MLCYNAGESGVAEQVCCWRWLWAPGSVTIVWWITLKGAGFTCFWITLDYMTHCGLHSPTLKLSFPSGVFSQHEQTQVWWKLDCWSVCFSLKLWFKLQSNLQRHSSITQTGHGAFNRLVKSYSWAEKSAGIQFISHIVGKTKFTFCQLKVFHTRT